VTVVTKPICVLAYRPLDLGYVIDNNCCEPVMLK
jgi:hypothetical protein